MKRTSTALALSGALWASACVSGMRTVNRALNGYKQSLQASVTVPEGPLSIGSAISLHVQISNVSRRTVAGCLGPDTRLILLASPTVVREGRAPVSEQGNITDHPSCKRRFTLAPAESLTWVNEYSVPDIGAGAATLIASFQVVYPERCHRLYGCYATFVKADEVTVALARPGAV
jgi:hypothetical protein